VVVDDWSEMVDAKISTGKDKKSIEIIKKWTGFME
jgi:hypothetical protein